MARKNYFWTATKGDRKITGELSAESEHAGRASLAFTYQKRWGWVITLVEQAPVVSHYTYGR